MLALTEAIHFFFKTLHFACISTVIYGLFYTINTPLYLYSLAETLFYLFHEYEKHRLLSQKHTYSRMPSESRQEIYDQIMSRKPHEIESLLAGWFVQGGKQVVDLTSINIGNIKEWLAWAFFMVPSTDQLELLELAELNLLVDQLSQKIGRKFEQGYNKSVKYDSTSNLRSLRINFDEPKIDHRPLILLILIWTIQYLGDLYLSSLFYTFVKYKTRNGGLFSYHVRFGENTDLPPLVLLHGMGIGVYIYALFVKEISKKYPNRTIFLVHLPHVASRLVSWESVSQSYVFASEVVQMLHSHGYQKAFFIGHSIGTIYANYMVKYTESVLGVLMIDPVCFRVS